MQNFKNHCSLFLLDPKIRKRLSVLEVLSLMFLFVNAACADSLTSDASSLKTILVWGIQIVIGVAFFIVAYHIVMHALALSKGGDPMAKDKLITSCFAAGILGAVFYIITIISSKASNTFGSSASDVLPGR